MGYRVTGQRQTTIVGENGQLTQVWAVSYISDEKVHGVVDIPVAEYTAENVDKAIRANVEVHAQVSKLGQ